MKNKSNNLFKNAIDKKALKKSVEQRKKQARNIKYIK